MTFEERIQQTLGQLLFANLMLQEKLEKANGELATLKAPKPTE
jgi:hypothetical protein